MSLPKNWPNNIEYTNVQSFQGYKFLKKDITPSVLVKKINEPNNILHNQFGLFATKKFDEYDIIGQYTGKLVTPDKGGQYVSRSENCGIDALNIGNELRFINDYRNVSHSSNVIIKTTYIDKKPRVLFVVTKKIEPGEQLLTDYGEGYWKHHQPTFETKKFSLYLLISLLIVLLSITLLIKSLLS